MLPDDEHHELIFEGLSIYHAQLDSIGNFYIQVSLSEAGIYKLKRGYFSNEVYIEPGDHLVIDFTSSPDYTFTGKHSLENEFLVKYKLARDEWYVDSIDLIYSLPENEFIKKTEARTQYLVDFQQTYQKENEPFTEIFAELIADEIAYDASIFKMNYPFYYAYLNPDSTLVLSDTYDTFLQNIEMDEAQMLLVPSFKSFLPLYLDFVTELDTTSSELSKPERKFSHISGNFTNKTIKEYLYYNLLKNTFETNANDAAKLMDAYYQVQSDEIYISEINELYALWSPLLEGQQAPEWKYKDAKGKSISLSSLKGNIVYIDVWASWCTPCIREIPYIKELEQTFQNKNISFVSISIDQDEKDWRNALQKHQLKGNQLIAENNWDSDLVRNYQIAGIPRFILIDKNGHIIDANAPRPSDKQIQTIITEALGN